MSSARPHSFTSVSYEEAVNILFTAQEFFNRDEELKEKWEKRQHDRDAVPLPFLALESTTLQKRFFFKDAADSEVEQSLKINGAKQEHDASQDDFYDDALRNVQWFENLMHIANPAPTTSPPRSRKSYLTERGYMKHLAKCALNVVDDIPAHNTPDSKNIDVDGLKRIFNQPIDRPRTGILSLYEQNFGSASQPVKWFNKTFKSAVNDYCAKSDYLHTQFHV